MASGKYTVSILTAEGVTLWQEGIDYRGASKLDLRVPATAKPGLYVLQFTSTFQPVLKASFILH
jgi:hypothetical protein